MDSNFIDLLGGTSAVARRVGISPPSVHEWRTRGIPDDRLPQLAAAIETATDGAVTRMDLRPNDWPEIWPELAEKHPERAAECRARRTAGLPA